MGIGSPEAIDFQWSEPQTYGEDATLQKLALIQLCDYVEAGLPFHHVVGIDIPRDQIQKVFEKRKDEDGTASILAEEKTDRAARWRFCRTKNTESDCRLSETTQRGRVGVQYLECRVLHSTGVGEVGLVSEQSRHSSGSFSSDAARYQRIDQKVYFRET